MPVVDVQNLHKHHDDRWSKPPAGASNRCIMRGAEGHDHVPEYLSSFVPYF